MRHLHPAVDACAGPATAPAASWDVRLFVGGCAGGLEVRNIAADFDQPDLQLDPGPAATGLSLGTGEGDADANADVPRQGVRELVCMPTEDEE